VEGGSGSE
jgi:hypothetical protein